jgi:uncharacterized protein
VFPFALGVLALLPLALLLLALLALACRISGLLLYPPRQPVTRTPGDCGLEYENVAFRSRDGLALKGWWIPSHRAPGLVGPSPTVLLLHPMFGNRQGFSGHGHKQPRRLRADVDLVGVAQSFHQAGYAVLAFDFRSHGESQRGPCAGGLNEDQDVVGAVDTIFHRIAAEAPGAEPQVGLVGFGLGATAALVAVGREKGGAETIRVFSGDSEGGFGWIEIPPASVKRLRFVVAIQPAALGVLLRGYIHQVFAPLSPILVPLVDRMCQRRGAYPLDSHLLPQFVRNVQIPVLYVQARRDRWGDSTEAQRFFDATPGPKQIWWLDEPLGRLEAYDYVGEHMERVLAFAAQNIQRCPKAGEMP